MCKQLCAHWSVVKKSISRFMMNFRCFKKTKCPMSYKQVCQLLCLSFILEVFIINSEMLKDRIQSEGNSEAASRHE